MTWTILIILFFLFLFYGIGQNSALKKQRDTLEKKIKLLEQKEELHWAMKKIEEIDKNK
jgi:Na+/H+ antiporter NhaC